MNETKKQTIFLEDKSYLKLTGITDIINLTETQAYVSVCGELLEIKGNNLKCENFSVDSGDLIITGNIFNLKYQEKKEKHGIIKRIFK